MFYINNTSLTMSFNKTQWNIKLSKIISVFDLVEDSYETNNILELCSPELLAEFSKSNELDQTIYMSLKNIKVKQSQEIVENEPKKYDNTKNDSAKPLNQALMRAQKTRSLMLERREELLKQEFTKQEPEREELIKQHSENISKNISNETVNYNDDNESKNKPKGYALMIDPQPPGF